MHLLPIITVCTVFSEGTYTHTWLTGTKQHKQEETEQAAKVFAFPLSRTYERSREQVVWPTCCHDEARCRLFRQNRDPAQLNIQQLTPSLDQVQGTALVQLRDQERER